MCITDETGVCAGHGAEFPAALLKGWTAVEEVKERHPDGRKRIHFILRDSSNPERQLVVVTADETRPSDRCASFSL